MRTTTQGLVLLATVAILLLSGACQPKPPPSPLAVAPAETSGAPTAIGLEGDWVRPSILAGSWYPADPGELRETVDGYLGAAEPIDGQPIALVVPHAGYVYSGPVAAQGFIQLLNGEYDVAVIIAADHQLPLSKPISVWAEGGFSTPLGVVAVDAELANKLIAADARISFDSQAHEGEHSVEIELPFLQRVCSQCRIVPILMGDDDEETIEALANALLSALPGRRAVVIASSDLSHYPKYDDAIQVDGATLAALETGDPLRVHESIIGSMASGVGNLSTCACGEAPIRVAMKVANGLGADTATVLRYANSGDSPVGEKGQVVGYGAVMFWRYQAPELDAGQRESLLGLARSAIQGYLENGKAVESAVTDTALERRSGVFVTLRKGGELRGCIGRLWADLPLYLAVQRMAVAAATEDPRFPPVNQEELPGLEIEISILSPFHRVEDAAEIEIGRDGLVIVHEGRQGLLLPQVPVDEGWDREEYLTNLCLKAGLSTDCWTENPTLYRFTAIVFAED